MECPRKPFPMLINLYIMNNIEVKHSPLLTYKNLESNLILLTFLLCVGKEEMVQYHSLLYPKKKLFKRYFRFKRSVPTC